MKVKIFAIGDELLIGQVIDTNSAWIASALNSIGIETTRKITLPDNEGDIIKALDAEKEGADAILITGGLGPTKDDKTKDVLTKYFDDKLVLHQETLDRIEGYFKSIDRPVTEDNRNQAMLPSKCRVLYNEFGTAPGMLFEEDGLIVVSMPGVPSEMRNIMDSSVLPFLEERNTEGAIRSRTYVTVNIPESILSQRLSDFEDALQEDVKLAYLPHLNIVRLRLTARTGDKIISDSLLSKAEEGLVNVLGEDIVWYGDLRMEAIVGKLLSSTGKTISVAESCTGGFVSHKITTVPGASTYFPGSVISYSYDIKTSQLQVSSELLWEFGAVSEEVVEKMVTSVRRNFNSDYGIAISGIAGPGGGTKEKPVGSVWMAVANKGKVITKLYQFRGDRSRIIERSSIAALNLLRKMILEDHPEITIRDFDSNLSNR